MDLFQWSLNAIDTIFSMRSRGSGEPACPVGTFTAGYTEDAWERWRIVCLATLSLEDIEDVYLFGTMITGFLLIGLGIALVYRKIKSAETAVKGPQKLPDMIEAVGRAVSTQTVTFNRYMENISEKLTALQRNCLMSQPAQLRVVRADHNVYKLPLPLGIPGTVSELHSIVYDAFGIAGIAGTWDRASLYTIKISIL
ncbi:hypothetical protein NFI96_029196, partial [Prochilodus magdalenae]